MREFVKNSERKEKSEENEISKGDINKKNKIKTLKEENISK